MATEAAPQPRPQLCAGPAAVRLADGEGRARGDAAPVAGAADDRAGRLLAVGADLLRHHRDRRDRAQPADRLLWTDLARPRVLHRRRRVLRGARRRGPGPAASVVAAGIRGGRRRARRADRAVRAAAARALPRDRHARPGLHRRAPVAQPHRASPAATTARPCSPSPRSARSTSARSRSPARTTRATRATSGSSGRWSRSSRCWPRTSRGPGPAARCARSATTTRRPRSSACVPAGTRSARSWSRARSRRWPARCSAPTSSTSARTTGRCCCPSSTSRSSSSAGSGTIFGSILGAIFVGALPALIDEYSERHPRRRHRGGRGRVHQCVRAQPGHFRPADRAVPRVRTQGLGRASGSGSRPTSRPGRSPTDARRHPHADDVQGTGLAAAALSLVLALAACGGAGEDDDAGGGEAGAPGNTAGFDGKTIKLGVLTPLSGTVAVIGQPLTAGNEVWFDALNAEGRHRRQVQGRAGPGGHAVQDRRRGAEVQQDQERRRGVHPGPRHRADAGRAAAAARPTRSSPRRRRWTRCGFGRTTCCRSAGPTRCRRSTRSTTT